MTSIEKSPNEYLFHEFGMDTDSDQSRVSDSWPFVLRRVAQAGTTTVFEFQDDPPYFALAGDSLNFLPTAGMGVDDLLLQFAGSRWIGARDPVDLATIRPGDATLPSGIERRETLQALGKQVAPGGVVDILEGLFLRSERRYLGLFRATGAPDAVVLGLSDAPVFVPFSGASAWRPLAWGVGFWLTGPGKADDAG
jgi:hypothetical protein